MSYLATLFASVDSPRTKQLLGRYIYINVIVLMVVLLFSSYLFYTLGVNSKDWEQNITSPVSLMLLVVALAGAWTALKTSNFQRTLLLQTISPVTIYWLRTLQVLFFVLPITLVTLCFYLFGFGISAHFTWDILTLNFLTPLVLTSTVALLSAGLVFVIRRISRNYLIRTILLVGFFGGLVMLLAINTSAAQLITNVWTANDLNHQFVFLISLLAAFAATICLLEIVFTNMPVALKGLPRFWQILTSRGVIDSYDAPLSLINRELLHNLRDASFQRRLIVYALLLAMFCGIGTVLFGEVSGGRLDIFAFSLVIALVASSVSYRSGTRSQKYLHDNSYLPISEKLVTWSFWTASLVTMIITSVFLIGVTLEISAQPWSLITFQLAILALTAHLVGFYFGAKAFEHNTEHGLNDLLPSLIILAVSVVPIVYYQQVALGFTLAVLTLWLLVLVLYLRLRSGKKV